MYGARVNVIVCRFFICQFILSKEIHAGIPVYLFCLCLIVTILLFQTKSNGLQSERSRILSSVVPVPSERLAEYKMARTEEKVKLDRHAQHHVTFEMMFVVNKLLTVIFVALVCNCVLQGRVGLGFTLNLGILMSLIFSP